MDKAVENALRRKAILQKEIEEIDFFLELHKKYGENVEQTVSTAVASPQESKPVEKTARLRGRPDDFADWMEQILREAGHPLNRPAFVEALERRGHEVPSDDKPRYLGTILWRHRKRFRNLPKFGYWLIGESYPPAGYDPEADTEADRLLDEEAEFVERPHTEDGKE